MGGSGSGRSGSGRVWQWEVWQWEGLVVGGSGSGRVTHVDILVSTGTLKDDTDSDSVHQLSRAFDSLQDDLKRDSFQKVCTVAFPCDDRWEICSFSF